MLEITSILGKTVVIIVNIIGIWFGVWVFLKDRKRKLNKLFFLVNSILIAWMDIAVLANVVRNNRLSLLFVRIDFAVASLFFIIVYFFAEYFPKRLTEKEKSRFSKLLFSWSRLIIIILALTDFAISFTPYVVQEVTRTNWGLNIILGSLSTFFYSSVIIIITLILLILLRNYLFLSTKEKIKVQYLIIGAAIFSAANIVFNTILPRLHYFKLALIGHYSILFFIGFTAYAIVKRELFGIKVVLTQLLVGLIAILLLINIIGSKTTFEYAWKAILFFAFLVFGYLLIKSVIEEIKRREQLEQLTNELKEANIQLEKMDKMKTEFLSIASHQLRTPLTAIKGYISMILEGSYGKTSKKLRIPIENVYKSTERLIKLVNNLLNISRVEAGKMKLEHEKLSLEDIISSVVSELKIEAEKKGLKLIWEKPKFPLPKILIDENKIRQAISNIIDNAIHYTQKGKVEIKIKKEEAKAKISISDTGIGMTKEEINSLFQSFKRGSAGNRFWTEGAGLGLYVAKKFVDMHKGKVWAESKGKGKGSIFYIELPTSLNINKAQI